MAVVIIRRVWQSGSNGAEAGRDGGLSGAQKTLRICAPARNFGRSKKASAFCFLKIVEIQPAVEKILYKNFVNF